MRIRRNPAYPQVICTSKESRSMKLLQSLVVSSLLAGTLFAQTQAINGSIRGRVTDAAGAAVPQAKVDISNTETGFARSIDTSDDGYYVFPP
ncbi:MAG: hypothetical protein DMG59_10325 [Acidobacteria bacterium]|nr:MAG: hypothetical protein DMG59_10325 [Acidobacteriota bacterium]